MRPLARRAALTTTLLAALIALVAGPTNAPAAIPSLRALPGTVLPGLSALSSQPVAPQRTMSLSIAVAGRDPTGLAATDRALYDPESPRFHRFLSPRQVAARFGAPAARWRAAERWLRAGGLHIAYASGTRDLLMATGSAAAVQRRFGVTLRSFTGGGRTFVANTRAPHVPAGLGITSVLGLNTFQRAVTTHQRTLLARARDLLAPATDLLSSVLHKLSGANIGAQTPRDILGAYGASPEHTGTGQSVAILGAGATDQVKKDLATFEDKQGLAHVPADVTHVGPGPFTDTSGMDEWDLDTQAAVGMAPGLDHLQLYFAKDLGDASVATLLDAWQADPRAPLQANASFGECITEPLGEVLGNVPILGKLLSDPDSAVGSGLINRLEPVAEGILARATAQGKTLFSSSGDTGSSCPVIALPVVGAGNGLLNQVVPFTNYPASSPYVTAVGGTVLYTQGSPPRRALEYGWTFGGGGNTFFIRRPTYQDGVANIAGPCLGPDLKALGEPCRGVPDVAAMSGDVLTNFYPIISDGKTSPGAGTSLSSPLWAGMWARAQSAVGGQGLGLANETIYRLAKDPATGTRDFHDITQGLLGLPFVGNGLYLTSPGWDYVTGWGTPNLAAFVADAAKTARASR
jgi:pseudomonalisin